MERSAVPKIRAELALRPRRAGSPEFAAFQMFLSNRPVLYAGSELVVLVFEQHVERGEPATAGKLIFD
jgi:hypothetical protein